MEAWKASTCYYDYPYKATTLGATFEQAAKVTTLSPETFQNILKAGKKHKESAPPEQGVLTVRAAGATVQSSSTAAQGVLRRPCHFLIATISRSIRSRSCFQAETSGWSATSLAMIARPVAKVSRACPGRSDFT